MGSTGQTSQIQDRQGRPLRSLRLSVTDRCNLRCDYCMPEENYNWLPRADILTLEEQAQLAAAFMKLGVTRVRLTGGEPLLRNNIHALVEMLSRHNAIEDLAMTTNALLLRRHAVQLYQAGLDRLTISLDSLNADTFYKLTRRNALHQALDGIDAAREAGFQKIKLNMVVLRDVNHFEIPSMLDFAASIQAKVRFIEYMDVGGANHWQEEQVVSQREILQLIEKHKGPLTSIPGPQHAPAQSFKLDGGQSFGIIASTTQPFCGTCDRSRITADGIWYHCLYAPSGMNLREVLRSSKSKEFLSEFIQTSWQARQSQGAKDRLHTQNRGPLIPLAQLQKNPRLEMHTRGG